MRDHKAEDEPQDEDVSQTPKAPWQDLLRSDELKAAQAVRRVLDGFEGKLTTSKWARLAKCSTDTALRDIGDLVARGVLLKAEPGGRSTSYHLSGQNEAAQVIPGPSCDGARRDP